jgi:asparagine synthase (glutamine-hydrolysing)
MCGIAGFLDPGRRLDPGLYEAVALAMADRLAHRGPDDRGAWSDAAAGIALGFRRLAILDLSSAGRQPMLSADGALVMLFNGEIYNHAALRAELPGPWRGHSDSEVLLAAIARWGFVAALERLEGMFAIALWDRRARQLWLARDRFGEKPLYWGTLGGALVFASELKALACHPGWTGALDPGALALFLGLSYVPAPCSAFAGIGKLPPGSYVAIGADGVAAVPKSYWSAQERAAGAAARPFAGDLAAAADRLEALIDDAVGVRMEADVPVGVFLSGGIDSSTVVAAMQRRRGGARSFSIAFPDPRYDESRHAAAVARHLGTEHTELTVSEADCLAVLPHLPEIYDEPFADASQIPTAALCRVTRAEVKVALSGDGGDELFGGYPRYAAAADAWRRRARRRALLAAARPLSAALAGHHGRLARRLRKLADGASHASPMSLYRDQVSRWRASDGLWRGVALPATPFDAPLPAGPPTLEQRFMLLDALTYLPDDLLVKVDRASMAVGLEARAPLLDHRIAEFAWSLPPELMVAGGAKRVLREVLYRRVPRALVDRPKQGFEPPIGRWLGAGLRDWADDLLSPARLAAAGFLEPRAVAIRWQEHRSGRRPSTYPLWNVLMLQAWLASAPSRPAEAATIGNAAPNGRNRPASIDE